MHTVDWEIFIVKKVSAITFNDKIKPTEYFFLRINGVSLYCQVNIGTKIKPGGNLIDEIFYRQKKFSIYGSSKRSTTVHAIAHKMMKLF